VKAPYNFKGTYRLLVIGRGRRRSKQLLDDRK